VEGRGGRGERRGTEREKEGEMDSEARGTGMGE